MRRRRLLFAQLSVLRRDVHEAVAKYMYQRSYNASTGRRKNDELIRRMKQTRNEEPPKAYALPMAGRDSQA